MTVSLSPPSDLTRDCRDHAGAAAAPDTTGLTTHTTSFLSVILYNSLILHLRNVKKQEKFSDPGLHLSPSTRQQCYSEHDDRSTSDEVLMTLVCKTEEQEVRHELQGATDSL